MSATGARLEPELSSEPRQRLQWSQGGEWTGDHNDDNDDDDDDDENNDENDNDDHVQVNVISVVIMMMLMMMIRTLHWRGNVFTRSAEVKTRRVRAHQAPHHGNILSLS